MKLQKQRGLITLNAMLTIGALLAVGAGAVYIKKDYDQTQDARSRAAPIDNTLKGAIQYAKLNQQQLVAGTAISGFTTPMAPTVAQLVTGGYLPAGFSRWQPVWRHHSNSAFQSACWLYCAEVRNRYSCVPASDPHGEWPAGRGHGQAHCRLDQERQRLVQHA
ncbi:hypothetical protein ACHMW6_00290 (plasmid) [Pseudoduganella sp. UC29_106]|uniref:hypothetical protein n=1 Tax=Pseudoduganella sp. UC29_106 TaxID=3374553 RepID=UPI003756FAF3